jgi:hypothetical protein
MQVTHKFLPVHRPYMEGCLLQGCRADPSKREIRLLLQAGTVSTQYGKLLLGHWTNGGTVSIICSASQARYVVQIKK